MLTIITSQSAGIDVTKYVYVAIAVFAVITVAFYLLRSFGIYSLAKKRAIKGAGIAFVPFVWVYLACKLIADKRFFSWTFSKIALIFAIFFSATQLLMLVYDFFVYFPLAYNFIIGNNLYIVEEGVTLASNYVPFWVEGAGIYIDNNTFIYPYADIMGIIDVLNVVHYVVLVLDLICTIVSVILYVNLFRAYVPGQYVVYSILSFFGLFAILIFVIRKKEPITYEEYVRSRYHYNPYNPYPYGTNSGQNGNPYANQGNYGQPNQRQPKSPFAEFEDVEEDSPFKEFNHTESNLSDSNSDDNE